MIATAVRAKEVEAERIFTIYEMLTVYRVKCGSFPGIGWVSWCWVHGKRVEADGASPFNAVENLRDKIESASVLEVMHG